MILMVFEKIRDFSNKFYQYLVSNNQKFDNIILTSHNNTDIDGLGSVYGLFYLLQNLPSLRSENLYIYLPNKNQFSKKILKKLSITSLDFNIINGKDIDSHNNLIIVVDTSKLEDYIEDLILIEQISSIIIIDHHEKPHFLENQNDSFERNKEFVLMDKMKEKIYLDFIQPSASSCSELVGAMWKYWFEQNYLIKEKSEDVIATSSLISQLLLLGLFSDSAYLKFSKNWVIPIIDFLISKGANIENLDLLRINEKQQDETIAKIKAAIRCESPIIMNEFIILFTNANSFESSICNSLIQLGADVAFCFSKQGKEKFRIIVRSSENFQSNSHVNFGKFMDTIASDFSGYGGGHKGAAGLSGLNPPENIKEIIIQKLKKEINLGNL